MQRDRTRREGCCSEAPRSHINVGHGTVGCWWLIATVGAIALGNNVPIHSRSEKVGMGATAIFHCKTFSGITSQNSGRAVSVEPSSNLITSQL